MLSSYIDALFPIPSIGAERHCPSLEDVVTVSVKTRSLSSQKICQSEHPFSSLWGGSVLLPFTLSSPNTSNSVLISLANIPKNHPNITPKLLILQNSDFTFSHQVNTTTSDQKRPRSNFMLIVGGLSGKSALPEYVPPKSPSSHVTVQPSSPSSNFKLLSGKFAFDSKRKINCKTRIYKCIKRILKRNSIHASPQSCKDHQQQQHHHHPRSHRMPAALRSPNAADYREIKTLLEKQHRDLEYDVNLAKCVEKPAFVSRSRHDHE